LKKNENWNDASLVSIKVIVEGGSEIQIASRMFGVLITSLKNHLYG
jgi:hypothetical protein